MTLSRFLRDYIYISLGGNRKGKSRRYINLLLTMLIGGIWHGAGWTFVLWGTYHGILLALNHALTGYDILKNKVTVPLSKTITFLLVVFGWVLFRAADLDSASKMLSAMVGFGFPATNATTLVKPEKWAIVGGLLFFVWVFPNTQQLFKNYRLILNDDYEKNSINWTPKMRWVLITSLLLVTGVLSLSNVSEFLYYQF